MSPSIRLGKLFGVPVGINYSWFLIAVLVTVSLAFQLGDSNPDWPVAERWSVALITSLLFFGSVLAHEMSHSLLAIRMGIPVHGITLFIFGGVSQISREASRPSMEAAIALVGPLTSFALAGVFFGLSVLVDPVSAHVHAMLTLLWWVNLVLGVFNMVPGFPLDGGRVFRAVIWGVSGSYGVATRISSMVGRLIAYGLIIGGIAVTLLTGSFQGLWLALIGWFLEQAATATYRQFRLREGLKGYRAGDLMARDCAFVDGKIALDQLVDIHVLPTGQRCFVIADGLRLCGLVTLKAVRNVPRGAWSTTPVYQVMTPYEKLHTVAPEADAYTVLETMDEHDVNQVPVVRDREFLGLITRDRVLHFVRTRSELGE